MIRKVSIRLVAAAAALVLLAACDEGTTPRVLGSLEIVSGDNQTAKVGTTLPAPLVVKVVDDQGEPIPGVHIAWEVATGSATLSSARTVTEKNGQTSIRATLTVGGQSAIKASIDEPIDEFFEVYFVADGTL
jgi:hypothetical protein